MTVIGSLDAKDREACWELGATAAASLTPQLLARPASWAAPDPGMPVDLLVEATGPARGRPRVAA